MNAISTNLSVRDHKPQLYQILNILMTFNCAASTSATVKSYLGEPICIISAMAFPQESLIAQMGKRVRSWIICLLRFYRQKCSNKVKEQYERNWNSNGKDCKKGSRNHLSKHLSQGHLFIPHICFVLFHFISSQILI